MFLTARRKSFRNVSLGARAKIALGVTIALGSLSSLRVAQGMPSTKGIKSAQTNAPGVTADNTSANGIVSYPQPPSGFDPLTASNKGLAQ